jgi:hypothetical protein
MAPSIGWLNVGSATAPVPKKGLIAYMVEEVKELCN